MKKFLVNILLIAVSIILVQILLISSAQADNENITTTSISSASNLEGELIADAQVYALPLLNSTKLINLNNGDKLTIVENVGKWTYIQTDNVSGWIMTSRLKENENITSTVDETTSNISENSSDTTQQSNANSTADASLNTNKNSQSNNENTKTEVNTNTEETTQNSNTNQESEKNTTSVDNSADIKFPTTMYVNVDAVYIRSEPNTTASVVTSIGLNSSIRVTGKSGDWYKVETSDGNGYMLAKFLQIEKK